jgi:hypothetical protein
MTKPERIEYLAGCISVVLRAFQGTLIEHEGDTEGQIRVLHFPATLDARELAERLDDELSLVSPADGWHDSLPPELSARRDEPGMFDLVSAPNGKAYPKIIEEAGSKKKPLRDRYDSQMSWHRYHTRPADVSEEDFLQKAATGTRIGDLAKLVAKLAPMDDAAKACAGELRTKIFGNFSSSLLLVVLIRQPFSLGLRVAKAARLVCPRCRSEFIVPVRDEAKDEERCPECALPLREHAAELAMTVAEDWWFLSEYFRPAKVWRCADGECGVCFPLPAILGSTGEPPKWKRCPCCVAAAKERMSEDEIPDEVGKPAPQSLTLWFYTEPPPPPREPGALDLSSPPAGLPTPETTAADFIAEAVGIGAPQWAYVATIIRRGNPWRLPADVMEKLCPAKGGFDFDLLRQCLLLETWEDRALLLMALDPYPDLESKLTAADVQDRRRKNPLPPSQEMRKLWAQKWGSKLEELWCDLASPTQAERASGRAYFDDEENAN